MLRATVLAALLCMPAVRAADPPRPNPKSPVDYVKWTNERYGGDVTVNAADGYLRAVAAFETDDDLLSYAAGNDAQKWSSLHRSKLAKLIEANAKCLSEYAAAARTPKCYFETKSASGAMIDVMLPELTGIRGIAKLTTARARLRLMAGDVDGAVEDVVTLLRAARHMQQQPFLIQYLVGLSVGAFGYDVLLDVPRLAPQSTDHEELLASLKEADRAPPRPFRQIDTERLSAWDFAQRYLSDTDGDGRFDTLAPPAVLGVGTTPEPLEKPREFGAIVDEIDGYFTRLGDVFVPSYAESREHAAASDRRVADGSGTILKIVTPSMTRVALVQRRLIASRHAYRVVFYLHAYHAKHDKWPQTLADALPKSEPGRLIDPFSNAPFGYRLVDGNPLLYTVGENGKDDGGQIYRENGKPTWGNAGDYIFYPRASE